MKWLFLVCMNINKTIFLGVILFVLPASQSFSQCPADSVRTYSFIGGKGVLSDVEYFGFDDHDSISLSRMVSYHSGAPMPVFENRVERIKSGGNLLVRMTSAAWSAEKGTYIETARSSKNISRKGWVLSEQYENYKAGIWEMESQILYTYSKTGKLLEKNFLYMDAALNQLVNSVKLTFVYQGDLLTDTYTENWDPGLSVWKKDWKMTFEYDSLNYLRQTVTYQFLHEAWVPDSRTQYGRETDKMVRYNLIQKWNGGKANWENEFYNVFQLDENDRVKTEIHLSWDSKDWKIDQTLKFVYNEYGELYQILNGSDQLIQERFCHQ